MNLIAWMTDTLNVAIPTGVNTAGELSYGTPVAVKARVEAKQTQVKDATGQLVLSDHVMATLTAIGIQDRIWLPGLSTADATLARTPLTVQNATDKYGRNTLYQVYL